MPSIVFNPAPPGAPPYAPNMTYTPKSKPSFAGDLQHDFRDYQMHNWLPIVVDAVSLACHKYLMAARMLGQVNDPIAVCLTEENRFDPQSFFTFYCQLAAHWRKMFLPARLKWEYVSKNLFVQVPNKNGTISNSYVALQHVFGKWVLANVEVWALHEPHYIRAICTIVAREHSVAGFMQEIDLFEMTVRDFRL